ncbi:MsnO8 family LLM class oxidoreductase [Kitasatospora sp. NBC_01539]|uniref:MsnO8 family LLM class oxidoreductase n=1 Tax=Kitasatospora sp. NBC_01539 TaxID=2903577 RepID=UPI0038601A71
MTVLSVLDQSPVSEGGTPADALQATLGLAAEADALGYHRYWVAEHHDSPSFAGTAPEILVAALLGRTRRLRVGSGGVLLPRYPAPKVAEVFRLLAGLHPGRVDLGLGRAGGPGHRFPEQVAQVLRLVAQPYEGYRPPEVWLLGAGTGSAELASYLGTRFAFAHFLRPELADPAMRTYRQGGATAAGDATGGAPGDATGGALAVRVIAADTEARARALAASFLLWRSRKDLGVDRPIGPPEDARRHRWTPAESERAAANSRALVAGTPEQVRAELLGLAAAHGVDEIVVNTVAHDPADRVASYRLLAEVFGLTAAGRPEPAGAVA